jgi:mRNA-degrading endonuclease toxin of MazEF toxin-antitoxin module
LGCCARIKDEFWATRIARLGRIEGLRIADELRRHVVRQNPDCAAVDVLTALDLMIAKILAAGQRTSGTPKPSVVNVSQLTIADRRRLIEKAGTLPGRLLKQVEDGLRLVLEL